MKGPAKSRQNSRLVGLRVQTSLLYPLWLPPPINFVLQTQTGALGWPKDFGEFPGEEREEMKLGS